MTSPNLQGRSTVRHQRLAARLRHAATSVFLLISICVLMGATNVQAASLVTFTVKGAFGKVPVSGPDPLALAGSSFQINAALDPSIPPTSSGPNTATYNFPSLKFSILGLGITLLNTPVTFTIHDGNVPTVSVSTSLLGHPFAAVIGLPPGTFITPAPTGFGSVNIVAGSDPTLGSVVNYGSGTNATVLTITGTIAATSPLPSMVASTNNLSFKYVTGDAPPATQTFQITAASTLSVAAATDGSPWISVSPNTSTNTPALFTVSIDPAGLAAGTYNSTISVSSSGAGNSPLGVFVQLVVTNPPPPDNLVATPTSLAFAYETGGAAPPSQTFQITASPNLPVSAATDGSAWVSVSPASGTTPQVFTVSVNISGLAAGIYNSTISITSAGASNSPLTVPVQLVVTNPPPPDNLVATPTSLAFAYEIGSAAPLSQTFQITASPNLAVSAATDGAAWISVGPASGTTPQVFTVSVNISGLAAGTYNSKISITSAGAANSPLSVPVQLVVTNPPPPDNLAAVPTSLTFAYVTGGTAPPSQTFQITASPSLPVTAATDGSPWVSVSPDGGNTPQVFTVSVNTTGLAPGTYNSKISITSAGAANSPLSVPVQLVITSPPPPDNLVAAPKTLSFAFVTGGAIPSSQTFQITASPNLSVTAATDGAAWISVNPGSGNTPEVFTVSINPAGLTAGTYNSKISITSAGAANSPLSVPVQLLITNPPPPDNLVATPTSLSFAYVIGSAAPASQTFQITASPDLSVTSATDGAAWVSVSPGSGTTPQVFTVSVNTTGLAAGTYKSEISITSTGAANSPLGVPVQLVITNPNTGTQFTISPGSLEFNYQIGGTPAAGQTLSISGAGGAIPFNAVASVSTPSGGSWLRVSPSSGTAPATGAGTATVQVTIDATGLAPGSYSGAVVISGAPQGAQQVGVTLNVTAPVGSGSGNTLVLSSTQLKFSYIVGGGPPPSQVLTIGSKNPLPFLVSLDSAASGCWQFAGSGCLDISFDKSFGTTPGSNGAVVVNVWVNPVNITLPGVYTGNLNISSAGQPTQVVNVTVTATPSPTVGGLQGSNALGPVADGQGWKTTILLTNTDSQAQPFSVDFFSSDGSAASLPLGPDGTTSTVEDTLSPGGLRVIQTEGANPSLEWASASLSAAAGIQGTAILQAQFGGQASEAAVALNSAAGPKLFLPFDQTSAGSSLSTGIGLTNPGSADALAVLSFVDDGGTVIPLTGTITVPANGSYNAALGLLFPPLQGKRGVVQINSLSNLTGMAMRFNGNAFTAMQALSDVPQGSKTVRHVANGLGWKTTLLLVNTDTAPAPFTLSFFADDGTPLTLPLGPDGSASTVSGVIAPGQLRSIQTDGSGNEFVEGSATLGTSFAIGGTAVFTFEWGGKPPSESAVPISADTSTDLYLPFDQTGNGSWGAGEIALANPGSQAAFVTVTFTDENGIILPSSASSFSIPSHGHSVTALGTSQLTGKRGIVHVKSSFPLSGFGIQINGAGYTFSPAMLPSPAGK